jgi:hypothetical protein
LSVFDPEEIYNHLSPPVLSSFSPARLFSVPQVENEKNKLHFAGVAEIQDAVAN